PLRVRSTFVALLTMKSPASVFLAVCILAPALFAAVITAPAAGASSCSGTETTVAYERRDFVQVFRGSTVVRRSTNNVRHVGEICVGWGVRTAIVDAFRPESSDQRSFTGP